ncbi:DNA polymerase III subunit epsilon [Nitrincola sp. MINF-07-Sa-05]|uniref:DNA polymerase III subunit epsilon n=1 Tax=Nitrincola salilacus TaxID=3400273 RepID=UPI00391832E8
MRQIVLDTETTGIDPAQGHNIIEIGCVEMVKRRITKRTYHEYLKPDREVEAEAIAVHGITNDFLQDKPRFVEKAAEFLEFVRGAELIIHNAAFDVGFLDTELARNGFKERMADICQITDTLKLARKKHPGQKNSLDALCRRYGIDNSHRQLHGALLDSEILADVYLMLTGGQTALHLAHVDDSDDEARILIREVGSQFVLPVLRASEDELKAHEAFLDLLEKKSGQRYWGAGAEGQQGEV